MSLFRSYLNNFVCMVMVVLLSTEANGQLSSPAAYFAKCYSHLTGRKVPSKHPLLIDSIQKNDHRVSLQNCMKVFDKARLKPYDLAPVAPGYPRTSNIVSADDMEGVEVLNYFFAFYNRIFEERSYANMPQLYAGSPSMFYDQSEDALYLLKTTFQGSPPSAATQQYGAQVDFDYIVKSSESLMGRRVLPTRNSHNINNCSSYGSNCSLNPMEGRYVWNDMPTWNWQNGLGSSPGVGYLTGIKTWPKDAHSLYTVNGTEVTQEAMKNSSGAKVYRHHGGGILGAASFIMKNAQYSGDTDGAVQNRRRAVKNAFSALLCRDMPPLKFDNPTVLKMVSEYNTHGFPSSSKLSLRESATCGSCHVSYDSAAAVYKNTVAWQLAKGTIDWNSDGDYIAGDGDTRTETSRLGMDRYGMISSYPVTNNSIPEPNFVNGTSNGTNVSKGIYTVGSFRTSKPSGAFYFEDWRGQQIEISLPASSAGGAPESAGIQELGEAFAQTDQFYVCFAKRLFNHFTGINISLEDHSDPRLTPLSASEIYYRDKYIVPLALGDGAGSLGLKQHKSVRRLIHDILDSKVYKLQSMRDVAQ